MKQLYLIIYLVMTVLFYQIFTLPVSLAEGIQHEIFHDMKASLRPLLHTIDAEDTIILSTTLLNSAKHGKLHFKLHSGLAPTSLTANVTIALESVTQIQDMKLENYTLTLPEGVSQFTLRYSGEIMHPLPPPNQEYSRGFVETPGLISSEGVYLANSTVWYPQFDQNSITSVVSNSASNSASNSKDAKDDDLIQFSLKVSLPESWESVSQGLRTEHIKSNQDNHAIWVSAEPQSEFFLIAAPFKEYQREIVRGNAGGNSSSPLVTMAFLRTPDDALANKYLDITGQYIEMYESLIGKYPYGKFALVENFWETGYGMPSFTLLGQTVIRLPFILTSSYPHEILHNWWGNGVFVDYQTGNWCEGLTSYLADHLLREQQGGGSEYRRTSLQKYTDYVTEETDFPLTGFTQRSNPITEAIGYGKSGMLFHMLRRTVGDAIFKEALKKFFEQNRFKRSSYGDFRSALEEVSGQHFEDQFEQWVTRKGAPELKATNIKLQETSNGFLLSGALLQLQNAPAFKLTVPIAIHMVGRAEAHQTNIAMNSAQEYWEIKLPARPYLMDIDPEFDVFRKLDRFEIPPALSQALGSNNVLILLPTTASQELQAAYKNFANLWKNVDIKLDSELSELPADKTIIVLGWENKFKPQAITALKDYKILENNSDVQIGDSKFSKENQSFVFTARHPLNANLTLSFLATELSQSISILIQKIPHYSKYSYLIFEGNKAKNTGKGVWPTINSPLSLKITQPDGSVLSNPPAHLAPRVALIELPEKEHSRNRMLETINWMSAPSLKGRELGTPELDEVSRQLAQIFKETGLNPGGDRTASGEKSFFQSWIQPLPEPKGSTTIRNVIGIIPGKNPALAGQSILISAHYDHLGLGWPDVHQGDKGKIHPGADDNASGVAVLLELARTIIAKGPLERTLIFISFSGEEAKLLGSKHFVALGGLPEYPLNKISAVLNMDTVGRLGAKSLEIFSTGSAKEFSTILMNAGASTGVNIELIPNDIGASDQKSFLEVGIPAIQLFSGANLDYHRPTDTFEKIDSNGLLKVLAILSSITETISTRTEPLTPTLTQPPNPTPPQPGNPSEPPAKRVFLGTIPDFTYTGSGVKLSGVVPGSPAEKADLRADDILVAINSITILNLKSFSDALKTLKAGDHVIVHFLRDEKQLSVETVAEERLL